MSHKYSCILVAVGVLILTFILINRCQNSGNGVDEPTSDNRVEELLKVEISLLEQATDILYNEHTPEGKEKLEKIHSAEIELEKEIDTLARSERAKFDNNPELKEAKNKLEGAKKVEELLKVKISLLEQATDILYNERTLEGKEKLEKIHSAEIELEKEIDTLARSERAKFDNNPELKEAKNKLEGAKKDRVEELLKVKISLLEQATDILYNEHTPKGKEKLKKIHSAEIELEKEIDTLTRSERAKFDNNPELKEAKNKLEGTKKDIQLGL